MAPLARVPPPLAGLGDHHTVVPASSCLRYRPVPHHRPSAFVNSCAALGGSSAPAPPSCPLILMNLTGAKQYGGDHLISSFSSQQPALRGEGGGVVFSRCRLPLRELGRSFNLNFVGFSSSLSILYFASAPSGNQVYLTILGPTVRCRPTPTPS